MIRAPLTCKTGISTSILQMEEVSLIHTSRKCQAWHLNWVYLGSNLPFHSIRLCHPQENYQSRAWRRQHSGGVRQAESIGKQQVSKPGPEIYHPMREIARTSQDTSATGANDIILGTNNLPKISSQGPALST